MTKRHEQPNRTPNVRLCLNDDGTWSHATVTNALLFDIRRCLDEAAVRADRQLRVLERIDRRLRMRVKLR